eukprot:ANDGO_00704.mRNA.1 Uncharacterized protein YpzJ
MLHTLWSLIRSAWGGSPILGVKNSPAYHCPKCGYQEYSVDEMREVDGLLTKMLNIQRRKFLTVSCTRCGYTDMFERASSPLSTVVDVVLR